MRTGGRRSFIRRYGSIFLRLSLIAILVQSLSPRKGPGLLSRYSGLLNPFRARMKRNFWRFLTLVLVVLVVGYFGASAWLTRKCAGWLATNHAVPVRVEQASPGTLRHTLQASGELRPVKEANVVARLSGTVKEIHYKVGDSVTEGALVATIQPMQLLQRAATAEASLTTARNQLAEKERQLVHAEKQLTKTQELVNRDLIAKRELDQVQVATDTARAQVEVVKAEVAQQEAMLAQIRKLLGLTRLTAPFNGVVTGRTVDPGSEVGDSTSMLTIASWDILQVTIRVPEDHLSLAREGVTARIRLTESPAEVLYGKLVRLSSGPESSGGTVVEIHVPNRNYDLKPGATVSVSLGSESEEDVLFVSTSAVMATGGKDYVYTVANGRAHRRDVLKRGEKDGKVAIKSDLNEGEWVVVGGQESLAPDHRVRLLGQHETEQTSRIWFSFSCLWDRDET